VNNPVRNSGNNVYPVRNSGKNVYPVRILDKYLPGKKFWINVYQVRNSGEKNYLLRIFEISFYSVVTFRRKIPTQ